MRYRCRRIGAGLAVLALASTVGCARPGPNPPAGPRAAAPEAVAPTVDVGLLDPGDYPTGPRPPLGPAGSAAAGRVVDGRRLAGYVTGPWVADPALVDGAGAGTAIVTEAKKLGEVMWPAIVAAAHRQPFQFAFVTERNAAVGGTATALRNTVLRFPGPDSAAAAARGMAAAALAPPVATNTDTPITVEPPRAVPIPGHPEAAGALLTRLVADRSEAELDVITARGANVLVQVVESAADAAAAAVLAGRLLDDQLTRIDGFTPTDPGRLAELPLDPDGLLARTLPLPDADAGSLRNGSYTASGALHLEDDPLAAAQAFGAAGVDTVAVGRTTVYRATDPDAAQRLSDALADAAASRAGAGATEVPGLPRSRCVTESAGLIPRSVCLAAVDRYAVKAVAGQLGSAQQQIAAQYLMLAG